MFAKLFAAIVALSFLSLPAAARDFTAGPIIIDQPWARATAGQARNGAAFFTLTTKATTDDRLVSASSPVAEKTELHTHLHENGVMRMRKVDTIPVQPGKPTKLEPSGFHVMLLSLKAPLKVGDVFKLDLEFEKAGKTTVEVTVRSIGAGHGTH
jgi:copper(I)-binding protein